VTDPTIDRARLVESAYKDSGPLQARMAIYAYQQADFDLRAWVLDAVSWPTGVRVLDIGCGPGRYLTAIGERQPDSVRIGSDLSPGMAREAAAASSARALVGDAQALPFADASFDRVLALHLLYHVPDVAGALHEFARVCAPGGRVVSVTNSERHLPEVFDLVLGGLRGDVDDDRPLPDGRSFQRFSCESAPDQLEAVFAIEEAREVSNEIVVPIAQPVVDYVDSMRSLYDVWVAPGETWELVMTRVRAQVEATIERDGAWRTRTAVGYFVCRV
jgi:SAM-dependent methyltransferase